jgi:NodT family efflux transporter outer membrane factor (OMF) lipoprotein
MLERKNPMTRLPFPLLLLGALLSGCAAVPDARPPAPATPAAWQAPTGNSSAPDWAGLLDPQLAALQAQALQANRDIAQAALRWQQAQTQAQLGGLRLRPSLGLSSSGNRPLESQGGTRTVDVGGASVPVSSQVGWSRSYGASASVGYELDLWGRLAAGQAAQAAQAQAARTDISAAQQLIRSRVAEAYWTLAAIAEQRPLAEQQLAINTQVLEAVSLRVREGKLLPIEIDKAAGNVQQAQVRLADLAADAQQQRYQLALLLDQALPGPTLTAPRLPSQSLPNWAPGAPAELLERRPDVQRARLQVDAALARTQAAKAERYPSLSFSAGVSTGGSKLSDWLSNPIANLGANLAVPLIDWRRLDLQQTSARTELELSALALRDTVQKALVEVENQLIDSERLQQQLGANAQRLQEAREAERLAQLRLQVGAIARADALQSQSARLEAEQGRIQLQLRAWLNRAALARTLAL